MMWPEDLSELLGKPSPRAARLVVTTRAGTRFRWMFLVESTFVLATVVLLLPIILLALFWLAADLLGGLGGGGSAPTHTPGGDADHLPSGHVPLTQLGLEPGDRESILALWTSRVTRPTLDMNVRLEDAHGSEIYAAQIPLEDPETYDLALASLLRVAKLQQIALVERVEIRQRPRTLAELHGRHALLQDPGPLEHWQPRLPAGCTLAREGAGYRFEHLASERMAAWKWLLILLFSPVMFLVVPRKTTRWLREGWRDLRRVSPRRTVVDIQPDGMHVRIGRGTIIETDEVLPMRDLIGIHAAARVTREPAYVAYGPQVRLLSSRGFVRLPPVLATDDRSVEKALTACVLELWERMPESAPHHGRPPPVVCPACTKQYIFTPGRTCPWCGSPPRREDVPG